MLSVAMPVTKPENHDCTGWSCVSKGVFWNRTPRCVETCAASEDGTMTLIDSVAREHLEARLAHGHFAFVGASDMRGLLERAHGLEDWDEFAASWYDLPEDTFMADGGRYRQRRHAAFSVSKVNDPVRKPAQPHYQSRDRNPLNGGIERWFEPVCDMVEQSATMRSIFSFCRSTLGVLRPEVPAWHVELHQFRILAQAGAAGQPTPEGMHRDGVDFVLVLLVNRHNVTSGTTSIADLNKDVLGEFTLATPLDAAIVDDRHVFHGVTAIAAEDADKPAYRDVLVVTWKSES